MSGALLLTEPEEATRSFLERHLRQDGFEVVEAENGKRSTCSNRRAPTSC